MAVKPRLVLVDAGAVIHAHRCAGWAQLCTAYEVIIPEIVVSEAAFYLDADRRRVPIDIAPDIVDGRVTTYLEAQEFGLHAGTGAPFSESSQPLVNASGSSSPVCASTTITIGRPLTDACASTQRPSGDHVTPGRY
ncbi:MAG: hypothetical protein JWM95_2320 [Gemmatimonadetes bacterium]|nr:hypothetical protein [Gemmatimonadota bacterium]